MKYKNACSATEQLSKSTLLAMLHSDLDKTKAIDMKSGKILNLNDYLKEEAKTNLNNRTWVYYENSLPRRLFLTNPNWSITSFDPRSRSVCVVMQTENGKRVFGLNISKVFGEII